MLEKYQYGAMSSKYELEAESKLTAYAAMIIQYQSNAHMMVVYSPEECKKDSWFNPTGQISDRLDEIFGGPDSFDSYIQAHKQDIVNAYKSIKRLV